MAALQSFEAPGLPRFCTTDPRECRDYIQDHTGTHRFHLHRSSHLVDFVHHECPVGRTRLNFVRLDSSGGFRIMKTAEAPYYSFQFLLEGYCRLQGPFGNVLVRAGDVYVLNPEQVIAELWPQSCLQIILRVDRDIVKQMLSVELHRKPSGHVVFDLIAKDPGITPWLIHVAKMVRDDESHGSILADGRVSRDMERLLLTMLLSGIRHSESDGLGRQGVGIAPYYVKRAEEFIRRNLREQLSVEEIAESAGVSARSLFYGFKHWRNTTPMSYVRDLRLDQARQELERVRVAGGTVGQAASNAGFTNFSHFSRIYKERFGETPSATLRHQ